MSNFPPFRAAPPKGEQRKPAPPADETLKPLAEELDKLLSTAVDKEMTTEEAEAHQRVEELLDKDFVDAQHVEHVRCCAKCFSTKVVDAVKINGEVYIKVS
jgi:hypothetical protein